MKHEHTSARVAKIAARIFGAGNVSDLFVTTGGRETRIPGADVRACMASLVTQSQDHADRETLRAGKLPKGHRRVKLHKPVKRRMLHK